MDKFESLKARRSIIEPTSDVVYDHIDEFMTHGIEERPWQVFELTQNQDVTEWINAPDKIALLQPTLADLVNRLGHIATPCRILDVGCYGGYVFDYLKRYAVPHLIPFEYTGVDIQEKAVEDACKAHDQDVNARFAVGDVFQLSNQFPTASFNAVLCYRVLHHLPRFQDCLRELDAVSRGFIHTALPLKERSQCVRMQERNLDTGAVVYSFFRHFSVEEIETAANALNLRSEIIRSQGTPYSTVIFTRRP